MRTIKNLKLWAATLLAVLASTLGSEAQFSSDFNSGLPAGSRADGTAVIEDGFLKLIKTDQFGQQGNFYVDGIASGAAVSSFTANFKMYLFGSACCGGGTLPADGLSFNVNSDGTVGSPAEEGSGSGLAICFDTWDNGPNDVGIDVKWKGATIGHFNVQPSQSPLNAPDAATAEKAVSITLDPDGTIDVSWGGTAAFSNLQTPFTPICSPKFVLSARTGGASDHHWVDDLSINATVYTGAPVICTEPIDVPAQLGLSATFSVGASGTAPLSYQWAKNGADIGGATSSSYTTPPVTDADNNTLYSVRVSNAQGTATSRSARLTVVRCAGVFIDFNGPLPSGAYIPDGPAADPNEARVDGGFLKLTANANSAGGIFYVDDPNSGFPIEKFRMAFNLYLFGSTCCGATPADGFSVTLSRAPIANPAYGQPAEEGLGDGLAVTFDTWDSGPEDVGIDVKWNGVRVPGSFRAIQVSQSPSGAPNADAAVKEVIIKLDQDGTIDVSHGGIQYLNNFQTPYEAITGGKFVFGARTGGANDNHWIDDLCITTFTAGPPFFTGQPADATINEGATATFTAEADGTPTLQLQWLRNGVEIPGANSASYTTPPAPVSENGAKFSLRVSNGLGTSTSREARLTVNADNTPPTLVSAASDSKLKSVTVVFSEPVRQGGAEDVFNYGLDNGATVDSALQTSRTTVVLSTSLLIPGTVYNLSVSGVEDLSHPGSTGNVIAPGSSISFRTPTFSPGYILKEYYLNIPGGAANDLKNNAKFINHQPDQVCYAGRYEFNTFDEYENYGGRMEAFFTPIESGPHQFYLAADDGAELYLSTDSDPATKVLIASEPQWRGRREWTTSSNGGSPNSSTHSPIQELVAGQRYYIESIFKEGGGGDHMAVGFKGPSALAADPTSPPNGEAAIIPGFMLGVFASEAGTTLQITQNPNNATVDENMSATFTVAATSSGVPSCANGGTGVTYQWQKNGVDIVGANGASYNTGPAPRTDNGASIRAIVRIPGREAISSTATLTVNPDLVAPTLVSALGNATFDAITVNFSELVTSATAGDTFNYAVNNGITVANVEVLPNGTSVRLLLDPGTPMTENTLYTVTVNNVEDLVGNVIAPDSTVTFRSHIAGCGGVLFEAYPTGGGTPIVEMTSHPSFPNSPDFVANIATMDSRLAYPTDARENYGARMRGLFIPPLSGEWIFYFKSDDAGQLFLNPNGVSAAGKVKIAEEVGCCGNYSKIQSGRIPLVAGQGYYIEGLFKEGGGGDYMQVAAKLASDPANPDSLSPMPSSWLGSPAAPPGAGGSVTITQQPASQSVEQNRTASFSVQAQSEHGLPICYQWTKDGVDIAGATGRTYTTPPAALSDNGAQFAVKVAIIGARVLSAPATLTVTPDTSGPKALSASGSRSLTDVLLTFNELLDPGTAGDVFNYNIPGLTIDSISVNGDKVTLKTSAQTPGATYTVNISNVEDPAGNTIDPNPTALTLKVWQIAYGYAAREYWLNIGGVGVADLKNNPRYPGSPDFTEVANHLEAPYDYQHPNNGNRFENYGAKVSGWLRPEVSGIHHFALSADDGAALFLSTDDSPANMVQIAAEPIWNGVRDFNGTARRNAAAPENKSTTLFPSGFPLVANQRYYFEAFVKEGGGGDNLSVTWASGDAVIPSSGNFPANENPGNAIDNSPVTKYLNFDKFNMGFTVTPAAGSTVVTGLRLTTANDADGRDPMTYTLEGTVGDPAVGPWVAIASGNTDLGTGRFVTAPDITFANAVPYTSYRLLFPTIRNAGEVAMQIGEVEFLDASGKDVTRNTPSFVNGQATINGVHMATLVPPGDTTPPSVVSATRHGRQDQLVVRFSEIVERESAKNGANYSISGGGVSVVSGKMENDGKAVILTLNGPIVNGPCHTLTVSGVTDSVGNAMAATTVSLAKPGAFTATGANNLIVFEAESFHHGHNAPTSPQNYIWEVLSARPGFSGAGYVDNTPNVGHDYSADDPRKWMAISPRLDYAVNFPVAGTYYVFLRGLTEGGGDNSVFLGIDGVVAALPGGQRVGNGDANWGGDAATFGWTKTSFSSPARIVVATAGHHTLNMWSREDGVKVDKFALTTDAAYNIGRNDAGPGVTPRESAVPLPVAAITSPPDGARAEACSTVVIKATASVECGATITRVIFTANGSPIGQDTSAPYELTVPNAPSGTYTLVAIAEDTLGRQGSSAPITATVLNSAPSFTGGGNQTSAEDAGAQSVAGFASNISKGTPCEASQSVAFIVNNDNASMFSVQPAISPSGTLTYTAAPNANGSANVSAVLRDNGGTAAGGQDTSAPHNFVITVTGVNDCPSAADQAVSTAEDTPKAITLGAASDDDGQPAIYAVSSAAAHGTVVIAGNVATYSPAANYCGPDSFKFTVTDGTCAAVEYTVSITVVCVNDPPTATIDIGPTDCAVAFDGDSQTYVISDNGSDATVTLTANSSDVEGGALTYVWTDGDGNVLGTTQSIVYTAPVGCHNVTVVVSDGADSGTATRSFCVISVSEAIDQCIALVDNAQVVRKNKRPLIASLKAAGSSADRGSLNSCIGQLSAFQNKVRAQIVRDNPVEGAAMIECAENILRAIRCSTDHRNK